MSPKKISSSESITGLDLKILRKSKGLTQVQAAEVMRCSRLTVVRMESGAVPVDKLRVQALMLAPSP